MSQHELPVYADRLTGQVFATPHAMIDAYLQRFAERTARPPSRLDAHGHTELEHGSARIALSVVEAHGVLLLLSRVMRVPAQRREELYERLLSLSFLRTADAAFAKDGDDIYVRALRRLSGLDYEEFEDLTFTVAQVADDWDDVLRREFASR